MKKQMNLETNENVLIRGLSQGAVWALAVGSIIGWGCFIQGANWTLKAGGPGTLVIGICIGALCMLVIGNSYSIMIEQIPVAGGEFAYAFHSFGRGAGFICGWMLSLGYIAIVALNATAFPLLIRYIFPDLFQQGYLYTIAGQEVYIADLALSCSIIIIFGITNYVGVVISGKLQLMMVILMCFTVMVSFLGATSFNHFSFDNLVPLYGYNGISFSTGIMSILALTPFLFVGFDCIPQSAEEYNFNPDKTKKIITCAIIAGACIYMIMAITTDVVMPWTSMIGTNVSWITGDMVKRANGLMGLMVLTCSVTMGIFTGLNGFYMSSSRLLYSMAREEMLPGVFKKLNRKSKIPSNCIIFVMLFCTVCPFFGREVINWVVDMCSVGTAVGYFFTCVSAYLCMKKKKHLWDQMLALAGVIISCFILLLLILPISPAFMKKESWIALALWVGIGSFFYITSVKNSAKISDKKIVKG